MSIRDVDVIDYVYLEEGGTPVLVVSDPLTWKPPEDEDHLELLREKLNSQIAFVENGQLCSTYPPYSGGIVRVEVVARHALNEAAKEFYVIAEKVMRKSKIDLQFRLCDA